MENFYNQFSNEPTLILPHSYAPTNEQAAWFAIAYTAACIEGDITEESREALCKLIACKEFYRGHEIIDYFYELMEVQDELEAKEIIHEASKMVSPENAPTLFCIVTETLLAKGFFTQKEKDVLEFIGRELDLDKTITSQIINVLQLKNKGNYCYQ